MKYIVADIRISESIYREVPFIFPEFMVHSLFAECIPGIARKHEWRLAGFISAGFMEIDGECHGKSESMKLTSRPEEDTLLIRMINYGVGIR